MLIVLAVFWFLADGAGNLVDRLASLRDLEVQPDSPLRPDGPHAGECDGCIVALGTVGIDASALVAGLGLVGLAVGLAMKEVLSNLLAGIMVLAYKPFKENDRIAVTTFEGRVSEINLRFTTLESGGKRIFIPNALVISNAVVVEKCRAFRSRCKQSACRKQPDGVAGSLPRRCGLSGPRVAAIAPLSGCRRHKRTRRGAENLLRLRRPDSSLSGCRRHKRTRRGAENLLRLRRPDRQAIGATRRCCGAVSSAKSPFFFPSPRHKRRHGCGNARCSPGAGQRRAAALRRAPRRAWPRPSGRRACGGSRCCARRCRVASRSPRHAKRLPWPPMPGEVLRRLLAIPAIANLLTRIHAVDEQLAVPFDHPRDPQAFRDTCADANDVGHGQAAPSG